MPAVDILDPYQQLRGNSDAVSDFQYFSNLITFGLLFSSAGLHFQRPGVYVPEDVSTPTAVITHRQDRLAVGVNWALPENVELRKTQTDRGTAGGRRSSRPLTIDSTTATSSQPSSASAAAAAAAELGLRCDDVMMSTAGVVNRLMIACRSSYT